MAQSTSSITGQVLDQSKAVVPNAEVVVTAAATGSIYRTKSNSDGYYTVPSLPAAEYKVSAQAGGFKETVSAVFTLDASSTARMDLTLALADSKQEIVVTAAPPAVESEQSMVSTTISEREMEYMPMQDRGALETLMTLPNVGYDMNGTGMSDVPPVAPVSPSPGVGVSIGGGQFGSNAFLTDGAASTSAGLGRAMLTFSADNVQEVKVIQSTYSAQYGSTGGGVVSMITKSGTNELHGTALWFNENPFFDARTFGSSVPPGTRKNEFGLILGGPVVLPRVYNGRNKTFFSLSVEPKRFTTASETRMRVATAAERQGDFRNTWVSPGASVPLLYQHVQCSGSDAQCSQLAPLNRPTATTVYPLFCANCPPDQVGHVIPKSYISPMAQQIYASVPLPNAPYDASGDNLVGTNGNFGSDNRWNAKIDHQLTANNRLTGRFTNIPIQGTGFTIVKAAQPFPGLENYSDTKQAFLSATSTLSPRMVNEARAAYTFANYSFLPAYDIGTKNYTADVFGLPNATGWGYPEFSIGGVAPNFGTVGMNNLPTKLFIYKENQYQFSDDFTMTFGKHTMTIGGVIGRQQLNSTGDGLGDACCGEYTFPLALTNSGNANIATGAGGLAFASFLVGVPNTVSLRTAVIPYYYRWKNYAGYFQDDFKVKSNLTLNMGVRYQYNSPRAEKYNRQANLDLNDPVPLTNAAGAVTGYTLNYVYAGTNGTSRYLEPPHEKNFEPRFGFAWTPGFGWNGSRRFVLRGGYGISHLPSTGRSRTPIPDFGGAQSQWTYTQWTGAGAQPLTQSANPNDLIRLGSNPPKTIPNSTLLQIPASGKLCAGCSPADPRVPSSGLVYFPKTNDAPYVQTWNLTAQYELPQHLVLSLTYMGQKGRHLYSPDFNLNAPNVVLYQNLLNQGGDPTQTVPDPYGRLAANGNPLAVSLQDLMRPYPTLGDITVTGITNSTSIYNAGSAQLERRFSGGIGFRANYTWAKSIDNAGEISINENTVRNSYFQDPLDLKNNRSVSAFDIRHRVVFTTSAELPFGKGKSLLRDSGRLTNLLAGGWSVNGIGTIASGNPFAAILGVGDTNGIPGATGGSSRIWPNMVLGVPIINPLWNKNVANDVPYLNPAAFARPAFGQEGNAPRTFDYARQPWQQNFNVSLVKEFRPFENRRRFVQLRLEAFNALNHVTFHWNPQFGAPLFNTAPAVSRTGLSLAGPIPYFPGTSASSFPAGSRDAILAQNYNTNFGGLYYGNNSPGRLIQIAAKLYW